jgi:hypothetical protein
MKTLYTIIIPFLFFVWLSSPAPYADAASDSRQQTTFTKHFRQTYFSVTEKAEFSIEILPDEKEYKIGKNVVGIVVHNRQDEDVEGADLTVTAEGIKEPIPVREKGDGLYIASNLDLQRQGTWKLIIQIRKKTVEDRAAFVFPADGSKFLPPGQYGDNGQK